MANASPSRWVHWGSRWVRGASRWVCGGARWVGGGGSCSIPNAFLDTNMLVSATRIARVGGLDPTRSPKASGFALQWNIGFLS